MRSSRSRRHEARSSSRVTIRATSPWREDSRLVYVTGAHFNNNLQDGLGWGRDCPEEPERFVARIRRPSA